MATLKDQYAEIELQLGTKEYECEVRFNYTPASKGSQFEPPEAEEFEVFSLIAYGVMPGGVIINFDNLIDLLNDEIIEKIKEQKEG